MKNIMFIVSVAFAALTFAASPTITGVTAQQRYPWNGKVDISYTITGDISAIAHEPYMVNVLKVSAMDRATGSNYVARAFSLSRDTCLNAGTHKLVWDMDAEGNIFLMI